MSTLFEQTGTQPPDSAVIGASLQALEGESDLAFLREMFSSSRFVPIMDRSWFDFIAERGRIPLITDERPPWFYYGWMLWQIWIASYHPSIAPRWPYYIDTIARGRLLDEPIPQINFGARPPDHSSPKKPLEKILEKLGRAHGYGERALNVFVDWLAYAVGADKTRPDYINHDTNEWLYRTFDVSTWLLHPYDILGDLLEDSRGKSKRYSGFFLSPPTICEFMANALFDNDVDHRHEKVHEPAVGTGRMLLAASNFTLRLTGTDIDPVCAKIARVNGALWAPSMTFPLPEFFFDESAPRTPITFPKSGIINANGLTYGIAPQLPEDMPAHTSEIEFAPVTRDEQPLANGIEVEPAPISIDDTNQGLLFDRLDAAPAN